VVHRAWNPHPAIPASLLGFWVTAADRPHISEIGEPAWGSSSAPHPALVDLER
jgi:hypothetical protein